jgi:DNA-binding Xre family transcriptional regulator
MHTSCVDEVIVQISIITSFTHIKQVMHKKKLHTKKLQEMLNIYQQNVDDFENTHTSYIDATIA